MEKNKLKGCLLAFMAALLWGVSGACCQFLFVHRAVNIEWLLTIRLLVSGLVLVLYARLIKLPDLFRIWKNRRDAAQLLLFTIFGMVAVQYSYFATIKYSNAATATVLQYLGPVLIAIYYTIKLKRLPSLIELIAIVFALTGTFLLVTHGQVGHLSISKPALIWGLLAAITLAFHSIQPIALLKRYNTTVVIGWSMLIGGFFSSFLHTPWAVEGRWDAYTYLCTAFIILLGSLVAFYAYLTAVKLIGAGTSSLLACAEPLSAALIAVVWLNVSFGRFDWIGTTLIVLTILLLTFRERRDSAPVSGE